MAAAFLAYAQARQERLDRLGQLHRRHEQEHDRLQAALRELKRRASFSDVFAPKAKAMETRLRRFERTSGPPERPADQRVTMRLAGGRTAVRAVTVEGLALPGLVAVVPFDAEIFFGERVAILGSNGTGKSHFLHLLAGGPILHSGRFRLGARVVPGYFSQTHERPELDPQALVELLAAAGLDRGAGMARLRRYELHGAADQRFATLSGGQQARLQSCCWNSAGRPCCCWMSQPTTWTWSARRRWRKDSPNSKARSWPSPTTAGSPVPLTDS